jgi:DNA-binding PadR family transcriptional regulator
MAKPDRDPRAFLPLTPLVFQVLLTLAEQPRHGYSIIKDVSERTDGLIRLRTGTLYVLLGRLRDRNLIEEHDDTPATKEAAVSSDARRRYYGITPLGLSVVQAEARRLDAVLDDARRRRLIGRSTRS